MGSPLGWLQVLVLYVLNERQDSTVTWRLASTVRTHARMVSPGWFPSDEGIAASARRLVGRGLVAAGHTEDGARCWDITTAGRDALTGEWDRLVAAGVTWRQALTEAAER